jgi:hypothetical protein
MFRYFLTLILIVSIAASPMFGEALLSRSQSETTREASLSPQAIPVFNFLKAAETGDVELYKSTLSQKALNDLEASGMMAAGEANFAAFMKENRKLWFKELEELKLSSLQYVYKGKKRSGRVLIFNHGQKLSEVLVVLEKGHWKIHTKE